MPLSRLTVTELQRRAPLGSSQPWIARASDGQTYLVKFAGAGPGTAALLAEYVVNRVARSWGFPVVEAAPIWLPESQPRVGTDELWDVLDASSGWNLALRYLPQATNVPLTRDPDLPAALLHQMVFLDLLFANCDRTTLSSNLLVEAPGNYWLIDHGSCLFLRRPAAPPTFELPTNHVLHGRALAPLLAMAPAPPLAGLPLASLLADVPSRWLEEQRLSSESLLAALEARLQAFASWLATVG